MERKYGPRWKETLELRNSLLSDSKTNAQTMLSLLREGELRNQPLSPPAPLLTSVATPPLPSSSTFATATEGSASTSRAEVSSPRAGTAKSKLGTAMRLASKGFEQSAGIISGQKKVDWENLSQVCTIADASRELIADRAFQLAIEKLRTSTGSDLPGLLSYAVPASSMPSDTSSISESWRTPHHERSLIRLRSQVSTLITKGSQAISSSTRLVGTIPIASGQSDSRRSAAPPIQPQSKSRSTRYAD